MKYIKWNKDDVQKHRKTTVKKKWYQVRLKISDEGKVKCR
jgi:predicted RNA-binding protein YlqC (UPF0109 family)